MLSEVAEQLSINARGLCVVNTTSEAEHGPARNQLDCFTDLLLLPTKTKPDLVPKIQYGSTIPG